ncbi:MAG: response regulator [Bryobacteraceae bacterium]|nr:response regulator [Bryobacteraceae bacterium]
MRNSQHVLAAGWLALPFSAACLGTALVLDDAPIRLLLAGVAAIGILPMGPMLKHRRELLSKGDPGLELHESEQRYRSLFENVLEGVYQTAEDGAILAANPALVRMLGYSSEQELKHSVTARDLYADAGDRGYLLARLEADGELRNVELTLRRKDGSHITVLENSRRVRDERTGDVHYEGTLADITERKRAEQELLRFTFEAESARRRMEEQAVQLRDQARELREARDAALEASRLKSAFLANVSHEIRTPMNGILGMIDLLLAKPLEGEQRELAEMARISAQHLLLILNDLLDFSKVEAGRMTLKNEAFSPREETEETVELLASRAGEKNLEFLCHIDPGVPEIVRGDAGRVRQVLTNLIGNAIKFTEQGSVEVRCVREENGLRWEIRDTGIGISPEILPRLFTPFYQADGSWTRRYGGTGLGLAISRELARLLGGDVGVESRWNEGSCFWFTACFEQIPSGSPPARTPPESRVLIFDPCERSRRSLRSQLKGQPVMVASTGSGAAAVRLLRLAAQAGEPFDFAICDARSGDWIAAVLRDESSRHTRLVRMVRPGFQPAGAFAGVAAIPKPPRRKALLEALRPAEVPAAGVALRPDAPPYAAEKAGRAHAAVLIAEDNRINQKVAVRLVQRLGYRAEVAGNGIEALDALERGEYALVLMDCQMPEMDGFEATARIREREHGARRSVIVAMTAHAMQGDRERCLAAGMDDYLSKPIETVELGRVLEKWLGPQPSVRR